MSGPAKVHSSEAIEAVRLALVSFIDHVSDALTELSAEMRRVQEWLEHDRPALLEELRCGWRPTRCTKPSRRCTGA